MVPATATVEQKGDESVVTKWWLWAGVAAAVGGGIAAAYAVHASQAPPAGTLGTIDAR
jgi:hypothetical protein